MTIGSFEIVPEPIVLGIVLGTAYGLLAVGFVLIHRMSRLVNLAQAQIGAFAAASLTVAVERWHFPYWLAFCAALVLGAFIAGLAEATAIRRLRRAPAIISLVATLGLAEILLLLSLLISKGTGPAPQPPWVPSFSVGVLLLTPAHVALVVLGTITVLGLVMFLRFTRAGIALRGVASEESLARLVGIPAQRSITAAWAIAGALSALVAVLILPILPFGAELFGLGLLARGLAAAAIAGMRSLPGALAAGIAIGVLEQLFFWNSQRGGLASIAMFVAVLIALLLRRATTSGEGSDRERWRTLGPTRVPRMTTIVLGTTGLAAVVVTSSHSSATVMAGLGAYALVGLSVCVVSGLAGQLSLGQFAFAGIGGLVSILVVAATGNFLLGFSAAAVAGAASSMIAGLPALRNRGSLFLVGSLLFALVTEQWLLTQTWALGSGRVPGRPIVGTFAFESGRSYALLVLGISAALFLFARILWGGSFRRRLVSLRDNEAAARSFGHSPAVTMLSAFAVAGALAGIAGALYAHRSSLVTGTTFPMTSSVLVVAIAALGGIAALLGPIAGALYIVGLPIAIPLDSAGLAATAAGWLILLLYLPGGLAQALRTGIDHFRPPKTRAPPARGDPIPLLRGSFGNGIVDEDRALSAEGLSRSFGDLHAVDDVSLAISPHEVVAIVGPNGAGKTTLLDLLSGFQRPEAGTVWLADRDVTGWPPERRAAKGLVRSFQDPVLYPTLTTRETIQVALERRSERWARSFRNRSRQTRARADELVAAVGLNGDIPAHELSHGMRRILQLVAVAALGPSVLLLDEPSSGLAAAEIDPLLSILRKLREDLGIALVIVSHELPLVAATADRVAVMEGGTIQRIGLPNEILAVTAKTYRSALDR